MYPVPPTPSTSDERQKGKFSHLSTNCKTLGIQFLVFLWAFVDVLGNRFRAFFSFYKTVKINLKPSGLSNKLANNMFLTFSVFLCALRLNCLTLLHLHRIPSRLIAPPPHYLFQQFYVTLFNATLPPASKNSLAVVQRNQQFRSHSLPLRTQLNLFRLLSLCYPYQKIGINWFNRMPARDTRRPVYAVTLRFFALDWMIYCSSSSKMSLSSIYNSVFKSSFLNSGSWRTHYYIFVSTGDTQGLV
jgi:hypothetical protein